MLLNSGYKYIELPPESPSIIEFPNDLYVWRINWIGGIINANRGISRFEVEVFISPIIYLANDWNNLSNIDNNNTRRITIDIDYLKIIYIGSFWFKQCKIENHPYTRVKTFKKMIITPRTTKEINLKTYDFYTDDFRVNISNKIQSSIEKSNYTCIEMNGDPYAIIIPSIEIIRFYFCVSSIIINHIFNYDFILNLSNIIDLDFFYFNKKSKEVHLKVNWTNPGIELFTIARILLDSQTKKSISKITNSCMTQFFNKKEVVHPSVLYPIFGASNLSVEGSWICNKDDPSRKNRFLVRTIKKCTADFPMNKIFCYSNGIINNDPSMFSEQKREKEKCSSTSIDIPAVDNENYIWPETIRFSKINNIDLIMSQLSDFNIFSQSD